MSKKFESILSISFSNILSILSSKAVGLYLEHSGCESLLCMEIILATFKGVGYISEEKERLKISTRRVEISFFSNFNIFVVILFQPKDLLSLSEDIMKITSPLSAGLIKKNLNFHHERSQCNVYMRNLFLIEFFLQLN